MKKHRKTKNFVYIALLAVFLIVVGIRTIQNISLIQKISQNPGIEDVSIGSNILVFQCGNGGEGEEGSSSSSSQTQTCRSFSCSQRICTTITACVYYGCYDKPGGCCSYSYLPGCYMTQTMCTTCGYTCTPNCAGKSCGGDGCGGSCGTCSSGYTCSGGGCVLIGSSTTTAANPGSISATVTDAASGQPISGAVVSASGPSEHSCTTDASGQCTIASLTAGTYDVTATANGYLSQTKTGITVSAGSSTPVAFSLTSNLDWGCTGSGPDGYCDGTENQTACPSDCYTSVTMNPNTNLQSGFPAVVNITFSDGRYLANHDVKFNLTILPEDITWDFNNYCQYGGVNLSSNGRSGTTKYPSSTVSNNYNFTTTFTCQIPPGLGPGPHALLATPIFYSAPITLHAVQVEFTVANNQPDINSYINSFISALKSFLGIK
jgi:hypothetical protein